MFQQSDVMDTLGLTAFERTMCCTFASLNAIAVASSSTAQDRGCSVDTRASCVKKLFLVELSQPRSLNMVIHCTKNDH